jgi:hypothetical protein
MRLAQEMAALHLAPASLLDDLHDLSPVLMPAIMLVMVLQPAMDELGGPSASVMNLIDILIKRSSSSKAKRAGTVRGKAFRLRRNSRSARLEQRYRLAKTMAH